MSSNPDSGDEELRTHIRTLTSLLHRLKVQKSPSKQPRDINPFLTHFTTLLTCGEKYDRQAKKVIAVTGSIDPSNQVRTLVVSQNPYLGSAVNDISLKLVKTEERPLEEVVNGTSNPSLIDHVADVWAALYAFTQVPRGPNYVIRFQALQRFFLKRSYRKFVARFKEDNRLCNNRRLFDVIAQWQPDKPEIIPKWVRPYKWLVESQGPPSIKSRTVRGVVEWEFSDDTKKAWSEILRFLLIEVDNAIKKTNEAKNMKGKKGQEAECESMVILNMWCHFLHLFVTWEADIVKSLLTKTNMVESIDTKFMLMPRGEPAMDETDDDDELLQEPDESKGNQVFRYLKTVVAWHSAVYYFCDDATFQVLLRNVEIGFVEVPPSPSSVLTQIQISEAFFHRFPQMTDVRDIVLKTLGDHHPNTFSGCVHAEATLMGLIDYYALQTTHTNRSEALMNERQMRRFIEPVRRMMAALISGMLNTQQVAKSGSAVIAVSKKCCWCCDWLGQNLEMQFKLPGTHGIMYPWDPPTVGISESVLQQLEKALWKELHRAVQNLIASPPYSRHSSQASPIEGSNTGKGDELTGGNQQALFTETSLA